MKILSIIIPCYNSEKTIVRTLNSIKGFEAFKNNFEIIIVNDGSTDSTLELIIDFFKENNFIYLIKNQSNLGLSEARNNGLKIAKGKYIWFVDSDDQIEVTDTKKFIKILNKDIDILSFPIFQIGNNRKLITNNFENKGRLIGAPYYIFNKEFLLKNKLFFLPDLIHEDLEFFPRVLEKVNKHLQINSCTYKRIITQGSITQSSIKLKRVTSLIDISILHIKSYNLSNKFYGYYSIIALNSAFRLCFYLNLKDFKSFCNYISPRLGHLNLIFKIRENNLLKFKSLISLLFFNMTKYLK